MKLYIQVKNGEPINHPAFEDNLLQVFNQIPTDWEEFARLERPTLSAYEVMVSELPTYSKVDGVWTDVWSIRNLTAEEKLAKQNAVREAFNTIYQASNWSAWVLDEDTCTMQPPIPRPAPVEGKIVFWCGADANWKEAPSCPEGDYKFDFFVWQWVAI